MNGFLRRVSYLAFYYWGRIYGWKDPRNGMGSIQLGNITVDFGYAKGDVSDIQYPVNVIPEMIKDLGEGYVYPTQK